MTLLRGLGPLLAVLCWEKPGGSAAPSAQTEHALEGADVLTVMKTFF